MAHDGRGNRRGPCRWLAAGLALGIGVLLAVSVLGEEPWAERRARIQDMTPAEKEELARRQQRFKRLDPAEKQRLRELDRQLASDERAQQLRGVMHRYYRWVTTLPVYERNALLEMPLDQRLARVQDLLAEQARKAKRPRPAPVPSPDRTRRLLQEFGSPGSAARHLAEEDLKSLQAWLGQYLLERESAILQRMPVPQREKVRELLESTREPSRRRTILATAWLQLQMQRTSAAPPLGDGEVTELSDQLTPELRQRLEGLSPAERRRTIVTFLRLVAGYDVLQHPEPSFPLVEEDALARFFEEKLEPRDQDRLLTLPGEDMQRELLIVYLRWRLAEERVRTAPRPSGKREASSPPAQSGRTKARKGSGN